MSVPRRVEVAGIPIGDGAPLVLFAGPCVVEGEEFMIDHALRLEAIAAEAEVPLIFKASYDKANRTSIHGTRGPGLDEGLDILAAVKSKTDLPIITDVHLPHQCEAAADVADVLQIPAFLCRQTDLILAAGETGKVVNIKKGQFLSPEAMQHAVVKVQESGNPRVWLTERGTMLGYQDMVVDMRGFPVMARMAPVIADITHSLQQPNQTSGVTGGRPELIATIGKAAVAAGANGVFIETHPRPDEALSDGANMLPLDQLKGLLTQLKRVHAAVQVD